MPDKKDIITEYISRADKIKNINIKLNDVLKIIDEIDKDANNKYLKSELDKVYFQILIIQARVIKTLEEI